MTNAKRINADEIEKIVEGPSSLAIRYPSTRNNPLVCSPGNHLDTLIGWGLVCLKSVSSAN
jgi:hypothetical protein